MQRSFLRFGHGAEGLLQHLQDADLPERGRALIRGPSIGGVLCDSESAKRLSRLCLALRRFALGPRPAELLQAHVLALVGLLQSLDKAVPPRPHAAKEREGESDGSTSEGQKNEKRLAACALSRKKPS